jgi:PAT family beta-lactamase induction signal transducer AmpG
MAALMFVGTAATFAAVEPARATTAVDPQTLAAPVGRARGLVDAVVGPFVEFFRVYGWLALIMFAMISSYQLPNLVTGPMANPFYHDLGLSKEAVGAIRGSIGFAATLLGITVGGVSSVRFGYFRTLIIGAVLQSFGTATFAILVFRGADLATFGAVMAIDNFGIAVAGVALVTYMSSLTSLGYTATQYALLSSAYEYIGKFAKGFSGVAVERLAVGRTLPEAYALFFVAAALLGIPAIVLCIILSRVSREPRVSRGGAR